jgi:hypothetical protein
MWVTRFLTCHTKNNLLTQIKKVVPSLPKDHNVSAFRQVELNPWLFALQKITRVHFTRRCCVWVSWRA